MRSLDLLSSPELAELATQHVRMLRMQLAHGADAVDDERIVRIESALCRAARACSDVVGIDLAYDAMEAGPRLRLRSGEWVAIPFHVPPGGLASSVAPPKAAFAMG